MYVTARAQYGASRTCHFDYGSPSVVHGCTQDKMVLPDPCLVLPDSLEQTLFDPNNNNNIQRFPPNDKICATASSLPSQSLERATPSVPEWIRTRSTRLRPFSGSTQSLFEISFTFVRRGHLDKCMLQRVDVSRKPVAVMPSNVPDPSVDNKENGPVHATRPKPRLVADGRFSRHIFNNAMRTLARTGQFTFIDSVDVTAAHPDVQMAEVTLASNDCNSWPSNSLFMLIADNIAKDEEANSSLYALSNGEGYHPIIRCEDMTSDTYQSRAMRATIFFVHRSVLRPMATRDDV